MKKLFLIFAFIFITGAALAYSVSYNVKSQIYHNHSCQHDGCKNCINIDHTDAQKRGGRPCKVCGG